MTSYPRTSEQSSLIGLRVNLHLMIFPLAEHFFLAGSGRSCQTWRSTLLEMPQSQGLEHVFT